MIQKLRFLMRNLRAAMIAWNAAIDHLRCNELSMAALKAGSDKGIDGHGYTRAYLRNFAPGREKVRRFLEIGLLRDDSRRKESGTNRFAPSLSMWAGYFYNARVIGFDICDFSGFSHPRCVVVQGDQSHRGDLMLISEVSGGEQFDIIIDDGSHASAHQQLSLGVLFPLLRPGGLYCIEDLHFQPAEFEVDDVPTTLQILRGFQNDKKFCSPVLSDQERKFLEESICGIEFYDSLRPDIQGVIALAFLRKTQDSSQ